MATTESESIVGYVEVWNAEGEGGWTRIEDVAMEQTVNCQLCNEPTEAWNIVANIVINENVVSVGTWQCRKCQAVNG